MTEQIKVPLCIHDGKKVIGEVTMTSNGKGRIRIVPHPEAPLFPAPEISIRPSSGGGLLGKTLHISEEEDQRMIDNAVRAQLGHCLGDRPTSGCLSHKHMVKGSDFTFEQPKKPKSPVRNNPWYNRHR